MTKSDFGKFAFSSYKPFLLRRLYLIRAEYADAIIFAFAAREAACVSIRCIVRKMVFAVNHSPKLTDAADAAAAAPSCFRVKRFIRELVVGGGGWVHLEFQSEFNGILCTPSREEANGARDDCRCCCIARNRQL